MLVIGRRKGKDDSERREADVITNEWRGGS